MSKSIIIYADDESRWHNRLRQAMHKIGYTDAQIFTTDRPADAEELLVTDTAEHPDGDYTHKLLLWDQDLASEGRGSEWVARLRSVPNGNRVHIGVTSSTDPADVAAFREAGADGMASKAGLRNGLADAISIIHKGHRLTEEQARLFEYPMGFISDWLVEGRGE